MKSIIKWFLNITVVFYLFVIYFSGVPETNTLNARLKEKATQMAFILGIWPSWSMFAPNPIRFDTKSYVVIRYQNGEEREYDVEAQTSGIFGPFRKARWMKYAQDNLRNPHQRSLLAPAIRHFKARYNRAGNPITQINLERRWREVFPFSDSAIPAISQTPRSNRYEILISQKMEE
jgi:hypothetical protein